MQMTHIAASMVIDKYTDKQTGILTTVTLTHALKVQIVPKTQNFVIANINYIYTHYRAIDFINPLSCISVHKSQVLVHAKCALS